MRRQLVVVCFGTPAIAGDSLGPEVGTLLREDSRFPAFVYGTLDHPITGKNMSEWMKFIKETHRDAVIVSVDACLGDKRHLGKISVRSDGVCPAAVGGKRRGSATSGLSPSSETKPKTLFPNLCKQTRFMCRNLHIKCLI